MGENARPVLISDVAVFDGRVRYPCLSVLVRDGVLAEMGGDVAAPSDGTVVSGAGHTLLPGLIDAHTHTFFRSDMQQALAFGVTTLLDMFGAPEQVAELKRSAAADSAVADLRSAGTGVTAPGGHPTDLVAAGILPSFPTLDAVEAASDFVADRVAEGSDYIKIIVDDGAWLGSQIPTLSQEQLRAVVLAAHEQGKHAVAHASTHAEAERAIASGVDGLAHVFVDRTPPSDFGTLAAQAGVFVIPTLRVWEAKFGQPREMTLSHDCRLRPYLAPQMLAYLDKPWAEVFGVDQPDWPGPTYAMQATSQLHDAEVPLLAGTDAAYPHSAHGLSMHGELAALVEAGLSPADALTAATATPAACFGLHDRGVIEPGRRADLMLVAGDPTTDIDATANITGIWRGGVPLERIPDPDVQNS